MVDCRPPGEPLVSRIFKRKVSSVHFLSQTFWINITHPFHATLVEMNGVRSGPLESLDTAQVIVSILAMMKLFGSGVSQQGLIGLIGQIRHFYLAKIRHYYLAVIF